jgi:uncharacterized protein with HEPN domain
LPRDHRAYLSGAREAADDILSFTAGKTFADFHGDGLLRAGVERKLEIVGEALSQLRRLRPDLAAKVPDLAQIIAFRNILVHGYHAIDKTLVWRVIEADLPRLRNLMDWLLREP